MYRVSNKRTPAFLMNILDNRNELSTFGTLNPSLRTFFTFLWCLWLCFNPFQRNKVGIPICIRVVLFIKWWKISYTTLQFGLFEKRWALRFGSWWIGREGPTPRPPRSHDIHPQHFFSGNKWRMKFTFKNLEVLNHPRKRIITKRGFNLFRSACQHLGRN